VVKLCGNFMILSAVEPMAQAMTLGEKAGVHRAKLLEVLTGTLFDARVPHLWHDLGRGSLQARRLPRIARSFDQRGKGTPLAGDRRQKGPRIVMV
jgi:hypothetical protein